MTASRETAQKKVAKIESDLDTIKATMGKKINEALELSTDDRENLLAQVESEKPEAAIAIPESKSPSSSDARIRSQLMQQMEEQAAYLSSAADRFKKPTKKSDEKPEDKKVDYKKTGLIAGGVAAALTAVGVLAWALTKSSSRVSSPISLPNPTFKP